MSFVNVYYPGNILNKEKLKKVRMHPPFVN